MTPDDKRFFDLQIAEIEGERLRRMQAENNNANMSTYNPQKEQNILEYQLDLTVLLDRVYHLLNGDIITRDGEGNEVWTQPNDDRLKIFSDYGVKQIMNIISFYINANTLLSNFDEETIFWKVRDFGIELSDLIFNRYEVFFSYPSPEELFEKYKLKAMEQKIAVNEEELYFKCVQWSREELQSKFRHYPMLILSLVDTVHTTFLRALDGEERTTLRTQTNIHQSIQQTPNNYPSAQGTKFGIKNLWGK